MSPALLWRYCAAGGSGALVFLCLLLTEGASAAGTNSPTLPFPQGHRVRSLLEARLASAPVAPPPEPLPSPRTRPELQELVQRRAIRAWRELLQAQANTGPPGGFGVIEIAIGRYGELASYRWGTNTFTLSQTALCEEALQKAAPYPTLDVAAQRLLGIDTSRVVIRLDLEEQASPPSRGPLTEEAGLPYGTYYYTRFGAMDPFPWDVWDLDARSPWGSGYSGPHPFYPGVGCCGTPVGYFPVRAGR